MATLKLTTEQAEFVAKRLAWRVQAVVEEKLPTFGCADAPDVLAVWAEMSPLVEATRELSESRQTSELDLVAGVMKDAHDDHRHSAGEALEIQRHIEAGEVVQWLAPSDQSAADAIERLKETAGKEADLAFLARSILDAIDLVKCEAGAAAGDTLAEESLAYRRQWTEENRKLAEAVSA